MKIMNKFYLLSIFFLFFCSNSLAENKIAYLNLDLVLSKSLPSKSLFNQLKLNEEIKLKEFNLKETEFKNEEKKILNSGKIISKDEYKKKN